MSKKQYWKGLEELNPSVQFQESVANEFREELPFEDISSIATAPTSRRDFLKYLGFTTAAATLAASCEMPVRKAIPYAIKPENVTPGVPLMFASTYVDGGETVPVLVRTREGRPIKIEGNTDSTLTQGATTARVQGSVLGLYDAARLKFPMIDGKEARWESVDKMVTDALATMNGGNVFLVTSSINSPSSLNAVSIFLQKYPGAKHVQYDAMSYSGMLDANLSSFGKRAIPAYRFDTAKVIVSIGADFLGTWISPEIYAKQYSKGRKVSAKNPVMSKHYQIEGMMSLTGGSADERYTCKPSQFGAVASGILNALNGGSANVSPTINKAITKIAADLNANKGAALVVCGSNDANVQILVNAINNAIGAYGTTISMAVNNNTKQGNDHDLNGFAEALKAGQASAVFFYDCNPAYDSRHAKTIADNLAKAKLSVSFNDRLDETTEKCKIAAPSHHWLESWGDAESHTGYLSLIQPTIAPLFKTRAWEESLLKWSGNNTSHYDFVKALWIARLGSQEAYDKALQKGIIEPETMPMAGATFAGNVADATSKIAAAKAGMEVVIYEKIGIGRGASWSNNPWLQEMPDPISKCTWDNYVIMSPNKARELKAEHTDLNEVEREKFVFTLKANGTSIDLPVLVLPGVHDDVVAVAVGYGRSKGVGRAADATDANNGTGKNVYPLLGADASGNTSYSTSVEVSNTGKKYPLAITQTHYNYHSDRPIVHEFTLKEFSSNPMELFNERKHHLEHFTHSWEGGAHGGHDEHKAGGEHEAHAPSGTPGATKTEEDWQEAYRVNGTLYPNHEALGLKWGMSIDVNACTGCGACTIACQAENNISVVGKKQVMLVHDMHWIRIDRYFSGDPKNPDSIQTLFQPMLCQHCDNAPCENVCPVNATNHSSEGINQMAYNRCIGTRYCANNCPYKVRRFNWRDWNEADCFADNKYEDGRRDDMNNDITRMVLNPDVTVRSRGVMEKCSFCVQRLQGAKATAKKEGRVLRDGEASTACMTACPTDAIVFGNVNDTESGIYKLRYEEQKERVFHVLEDIHTLPNINYLSKIRNADEVMSQPKEHHAEAAHAEEKHS
ncbi:MAG: TAT-variant-translocated molybdopterin oxidoreductase [Chitinophagaceae bacterium]|nr:TAT-variant-translocated molybdopterin oxidoreductase [Chitinophagaceae bacterium]